MGRIQRPGEAQRVKLASFLAKESSRDKILFIFDEPTTGLHFHDIKQLLKVLHTLRDHGNTIVVIEHNLDAIKTADWVIDLGLDASDEGGQLVPQATPPTLAKNKKSHTAKALRAG